MLVRLCCRDNDDPELGHINMNHSFHLAFTFPLSFCSAQPLLRPLTRFISFGGMSLALAVSMLFMQEVLAQDAHHHLPPVVVTGQAAAGETLPSIESARQRLKTIPGGANVVDAEQYKEGRVSTLDDALKFSPGVFIASRFGAEEARLSIRGSGLQRTFHMRGIQLLQDGVPLNLADGSADFQAMEPLSARYAEVYRGANARQFGAATLGGAVNFVSPSGFDSPRVGARLEAGSFGYARAQAYTGGASEQRDWFFSASHFQQDGYRQHAKQNTQRVNGNLGWQVNEVLETQFFLGVVQTDSELPGALTRSEMESNPRVASPGNLSGHQKRDFDLARLSTLSTVKLDSERRIEAGAFYSYKSLFHPIHQVLDQDSHDYGLNLRYVSEAMLAGKRNRLILGTLAQAGRVEDDRFDNIGGQRGARRAQATQDARNFSVYVENLHYFIPSTALIAGLQALHARRELKDYFLSDGDNSVDRAYRHVSPKLGVLHEMSPGIQVYANVSGSVEPPTFGELAGGPTVTPVNAQKATTLEAGSRGVNQQPWGKVSWDVSLYHAQMKDELLALTDTNNNPLGTINAGRTLHRGLEAGMEAHVGSRWIARFNYLFNDFRFDDHAVYRSNRLAGVPRQLLQAELLYKLDTGMYFGPNLRVVSSAYIDHANTLTAAGHAIFGFKVGQQVSRRLSWFIDGRNLDDNNYVATTSVVANANGLDGRYYFPGDGRSVYAGIALTY